MFEVHRLAGCKQSTKIKSKRVYTPKVTPFWNHPVNQETASLIRQAFLENGGETCKRVLQLLKSACDWGAKQEKMTLKHNPFEGMAKEVKSRKRVSPITGIPQKYVAYTQEETQLILREIKRDVKASPYYNCFRFLFSTGCRTGEALALTWADVDFIRREIYFNKSYNEDWGISEGSKNNKSRSFPMNDNLWDWLESIKPKAAQPQDICFTGTNSQHIKHRKLWLTWGDRSQKEIKNNGIVIRLAFERLIFDYLPPYNTRHTFINHCLDHQVDSITIADWCDNSDDIIQKVYRSKQRNIDINYQMPSF